MKILLVSCLLSLFAAQGHEVTKVYISTGSAAYAYHAKKTCRSLKRCNEEGHVKVITLEEAKQKGRTPCKICYR